MALSGFLFLSWRIWEMVILIPIVGMLAWFVNGFVSSNVLTPTYVLLLFIVSVLALAWTFFTTISYLRARHDAMFVALVDLCFVGALIAGVVELRGITSANCSNFSASSFWAHMNYPFGPIGRQYDTSWSSNINKPCSMLKACFALAIIAILSFFVTFLLALLVHRHHKNDDAVVVKREYKHSSRHANRRSGSRDHRSSRDYSYRPASSGHRSGTRRSSSRRRDYYV